MASLHTKILKIWALFSLAIIITTVNIVESTRASTWDSCGCYWAEWQSWSKCSSECGGRSRRERKVWHHDIPSCDGFEYCDDGSGGWDHKDCNTFCFNGGTFSANSWLPCRCVDGWRGRCCKERVVCGDPGEITNGKRTGSAFDYGHTITYSCNQYYNMTIGFKQITCSKYGIWNGQKPTCTFVNTCMSNPCRNGGTCIDGLNQYRCNCHTGWSGVHCERDIQPPVLNGCPSNMSLNVARPSVNVSWNVPNFIDPLGTHIKISSNYPVNKWDFPWGDFDVQYSALKPLNGLRTECNFRIKVRPNQCKALNFPLNGAKVCNGWKTDFGQYCIVFCQSNFTLSRIHDYRQWYVCGASGTWIPSTPLPDCTVHHSIMNTLHGDEADFSFQDCKNQNSTDKIKSMYIQKLKASKFRAFCDQYTNLCSDKNVIVTCM